MNMQRIKPKETAEQMFFVRKINILDNGGEAEKMTQWPELKLS
jgi:hypothetical protein